MPVSYSGTAITWPDNSTSTSGWTGFKNRLINGGMVVDQRNAGASVNISGGAYTVDRWEGLENGSMAFTVQQSSTAPTGFTNSVLITTTTAASPGSTDRSQFEQYIEGYNIADFGWGTANAQPVTLSFWVRSSLTGQFGGALANGAGNRSYPYSYNISSANTWEYKTITVLGDTSGTWDTTNGRALCVYFDLGMGSTLLGTAGAWAGSDFRGAIGDVKLSATSGATFYITGVQLERGLTASSFDYLDYGRQLIQCQRYYEKRSFPSGNNICPAIANASSSNTQTIGNIDLLVQKRATPTVTASAASTFGYGWLGGGVTANSILVLDATVTTGTLALGLGSSASQVAGYFSGTNAFLAFDSEL